MLKAMLKKKKRGFTLIELIVVIAILGILAAVLLPRFMGFTDDAKKNALMADAKNIMTAIESLTANNKTFTEVNGADTTTNYSNAEVMGYIGKALGGQLEITVVGTGTTGAVATFTYTKTFGNDSFEVTGYVDDVSHTSGTFTAVKKNVNTPVAAGDVTVLDDTFE